MSQVPVQAHDLQKDFRGRLVLHGVDLQVADGEMVGLVGPNGAGKSTLLRLLLGLSRRRGGMVAMFGLDPAHDPIAVRRRCSYLPGETSVYQQMTGRQFLDFALSFYGRCNEPLLQRLAGLFALPLGARVRSYSAGMKQKLAILAALAPDVDLYVLDEPDRALDATMRLQLREVLLQLHGQGKTIIVSSHHLAELETIAARLLFLRAGRIVPDLEVEAARARLDRRFRLHLQPGTALPGSATLLGRDADGTLVLEAQSSPLDCLRELPPTAVRSVEVGIVRLEDLYQQLFAPQAAPETATA